MEKHIFEAHNLEDKGLPIIFHYDTIIKHQNEPYVHWHNNIEILYVTTGCGNVFLSPDTYEISEGDIVIVNSNVLHQTMSNSHLEYYCLIIDTEFLSSNDLPVEDIEYIPIIRDTTAQNIFSELAAEISCDMPFKNAAIKNNVLKLLIYLSRNYISTQKREHFSSADENIKLAIGYIKSHLASPLSLEEISNEAGLSKYYFLREFKKSTGMTPTVFINTLRCQNAKKLLLKNKYSIHEVASKCGFENDSYFSKTFKKYTGLLPSEFTQKSNIVSF